MGIASAFLMLAGPTLAAKRIALVIGNNDYRNVSKLQKAVNDARTMGDTLKQLGFTVRSVPMSRGTPFANVLLVADLTGPA